MPDGYVNFYGIIMKFMLKKSEENTLAPALSKLPIEANLSDIDNYDEVMCDISLEFSCYT